MPRKKHVPPGVQAHLDRIKAADTLRALDGVFAFIEAVRESTDDRAAFDASNVEIWYSYRARYLELAGTDPPIPDDPLAPAEEQGAFREAVSRLWAIEKEVAEILWLYKNPQPYHTLTVRELETVLKRLGTSSLQAAARCRARIRRSPFKLIPGGKS
jgi:hypothetical protein